MTQQEQSQSYPNSSSLSSEINRKQQLLASLTSKIEKQKIIKGLLKQFRYDSKQQSQSQNQSQSSYQSSGQISQQMKQIRKFYQNKEMQFIINSKKKQQNIFNIDQNNSLEMNFIYTKKWDLPPVLQKQRLYNQQMKNLMDTWINKKKIETDYLMLKKKRYQQLQLQKQQIRQEIFNQGFKKQKQQTANHYQRKVYIQQMVKLKNKGYSLKNQKLSKYLRLLNNEKKKLDKLQVSIRSYKQTRY